MHKMYFILFFLYFWQNMHMYKVCFLFFSARTYVQNIFYFVYFIFVTKICILRSTFCKKTYILNSYNGRNCSKISGNNLFFRVFCWSNSLLKTISYFFVFCFFLNHAPCWAENKKTKFRTFSKSRNRGENETQKCVQMLMHILRQYTLFDSNCWVLSILGKTNFWSILDFFETYSKLNESTIDIKRKKYVFLI